MKLSGIVYFFRIREKTSNVILVVVLVLESKGLYLHQKPQDKIPGRVW